MNKRHIYSLVFIAGIAQQIYASQNENLSDYQKAVDYHLRKYTGLKSFVQKHTPPYNLLKQIIEEEWIIYGNRLRYNNNQNDIYVKDYDITRPLFASRMKRYINEKRYRYVDVPDKYIVLIENGDESKALRVIAQKVGYSCMDSEAIIGLGQIKEITDVVMTLGYTDLVKPYSEQQNLVINNRNGKFTFIDTDSCAFDTSKSRALCAVLALDQQLEICNASLDDDANDWLSTRISEAEEDTFTALSDCNDLEEFQRDYEQIKAYRSTHNW